MHRQQESVGQRVRRLRRQLNLTQGELADRVDKSTQHVSLVERDRIGFIPGPTQAAYAAALGVSPAYLLYGISTAEEANLPAPYDYLIEATNLSPAQAEQVAQIIEALEADRTRRAQQDQGRQDHDPGN